MKGPRETLQAIAERVRALGGECPQLRSFDPSQHLHADGLVITYDYHTHRSTGLGGWTAAVPNPDPDGIWLYIDIHDAFSEAQIHTQPMVPVYDVGGRQVLFMLVLEGSQVPSCAQKLQEILASYGRPVTL
ncbi:MAG: hypothetical protein U0271_26980 [Polyangiaceae bacterium]